MSAETVGQRRRQTTLGDVAKLAGVSIATASKALNGRDQVSPVTRARVHEAAEQLSFSPNALARGGRYDHVGEAFGRARPATGFSMDLREVARLVPTGKRVGAILAPHIGKDARLAAHIGALREQGEIVVELLPGETACEGPVCDRKLALVGEHWIIEAIQED